MLAVSLLTDVLSALVPVPTPQATEAAETFAQTLTSLWSGDSHDGSSVTASDEGEEAVEDAPRELDEQKDAAVVIAVPVFPWTPPLEIMTVNSAPVETCAGSVETPAAQSAATDEQPVQGYASLPPLTAFSGTLEAVDKQLVQALTSEPAPQAATAAAATKIDIEPAEPSKTQPLVPVVAEPSSAPEIPSSVEPAPPSDEPFELHTARSDPLRSQPPLRPAMESSSEQVREGVQDTGDNPPQKASARPIARWAAPAQPTPHRQPAQALAGSSSASVPEQRESATWSGQPVTAVKVGDEPEHEERARTLAESTVRVVPHSELGTAAVESVPAAGPVRTGPSVSASPRKPATPEAPRTERLAEPTAAPLAVSRPVDAISVAVGGKDGQPRAEIVLQQRGDGVIHMAVRTPDPQFATTLRAGLPELGASLEMRGYRSEIDSRSSDSMQQQEHRPRGDSTDEPPHRRPRWIYERNEDDD